MDLQSEEHTKRHSKLGIGERTMNKEQIEEMAKIIHGSVNKNKPCPDEEYGGFSCLGCDYIDKGYCQHDMEQAMALYNADYRRQSEVARDIINQLEDVSNFNEATRMVSIPLDKFDEIANKYIERCFFLRMTHTCPHRIPNLIPTIEELLKGGAE